MMTMIMMINLLIKLHVAECVRARAPLEIY